ncbi:PilW family protein [Chondromyces crocatus]|uniref:Prepilin-type N-terminal cleavage/methylation domain-containing protein n=1 Tax=Chondromyces crocatus TaxID=52 RepID=A0A0K1EFM1_CHOCO|nr:prepilin-type N-terminal cleavage/methylation domain-containing protein [Chondromyces crocatus]AKT39383.1 uncharacterized protein CMC5_035300 [Chondromyces crocatus]
MSILRPRHRSTQRASAESLPSRTATPSPRSRRGFTLVELIIAMAAGLAVATAAMLLAKNASRFFQYEARFSAAHLGAMLGMQRLTADIQRAAFLSTPNIQLDPMTCRPPSAWPDGLQRLAGIQILREGSFDANPTALAQSAANNFFPDALIIGGAFGTNEQFDVQAIFSAGGGLTIQLQRNSGAMRRTLMRASAGNAAFDGIFRPGRAIRITTDGQPPIVYGVIEGANAGTLTIQLRSNPALPYKDAGPCGISRSGSNANFLVTPVTRVRYDIRSLTNHPDYGQLVAPISEGVTGDQGRTELVRVELDADNVEIANTLEIVSEYAVDLKFGISTAALVTSSTVNPEVVRYPIRTPVIDDVYTIANDITNGGTPQRIRAVQARLSTRTRAPDRDADLYYPTGTETRHLRFLIPGVVPAVNTLGDPIPAGAPAVFARMRTLHAEVSLPNNEKAQRW